MPVSASEAVGPAPRRRPCFPTFPALCGSAAARISQQSRRSAAEAAGAAICRLARGQGPNRQCDVISSKPWPIASAPAVHRLRLGGSCVVGGAAAAGNPAFCDRDESPGGRRCRGHAAAAAAALQRRRNDGVPHLQLARRSVKTVALPFARFSRAQRAANSCSIRSTY